MKWIVIGVVGFVSVVAIGYGVWQKFEVATNQPEFIDSYKTSFAENCIESAVKSLASSGRVVDDAAKAKLGQICSCGADVSAAEFQREEHMSIANMMKITNSPAFRQKVAGIMHTCQQQISPQ